MAVNLDITVARNEVWGRSFQLCDGVGNPYDLSGLALEGEVKTKLDNSTPVTSFIFEIADAANGIFSASLDATEGSALNAYGSPLQVENLRYDIRAVDSDRVRQRLVFGTVILERGVTQA